MPVLINGKIVNRSKIKLKSRNSKRRKRQAPTALAAPVKLRGPKNRTYFLYELELEGGFYYVGISTTDGATARFDQHYLGTGARWTALHRPIRIMRTEALVNTTKVYAHVAENCRTRELIERYGVEKVRGGNLCAVNDEVHRKMYSRSSL